MATYFEQKKARLEAKLANLKTSHHSHSLLDGDIRLLKKLSESIQSIENELIKTNEEISNEGNQAKINELHLNMQYYMEYCSEYGYVTPKDWLANYKHF